MECDTGKKRRKESRHFQHDAEGGFYISPEVD